MRRFFEIYLRVFFILSIIFLSLGNYDCQIALAVSKGNDAANSYLKPDSSTNEEFQLVHLTTYETFDGALGVYIEDDLVYIADRHQDLHIVDISDPYKPEFVANGQFASSTRFGIEVRDNYCYIAGWNNRLPIFDVSTPSSPVLVNSLYGSNDAHDFVIIDDLIYIADWIHGMYIYNISDPTAPIAMGSYSNGYRGSDIEIEGDIAYIATTDGLLVLNISNPNIPVYENLYVTADRIDGITIQDNLAYLGAGTQGLIIVNITDETNPTYVNSYDTPSYTPRVVLKYNCAFLCDGAGGLHIVNVTDPYNLVLVSELSEYQGAANICFKDDFAYLANADYGLEIFYIETKSNEPVLSHGQLDPASAYPGSSFDYSVTYTDANNVEPTFVKVYIDNIEYSMTKQNLGDTNYTDGCIYEYSKVLTTGAHNYYFEASNGTETLRIPYSGSFSGPEILVPNRSPVLTNGQVSPTTGHNVTVFNFTVIYTDIDNDPPTYIRVVIDGVLLLSMEQLYSSDTDYTDGCLFIYSTTLHILFHNYYFIASDEFNFSRLPEESTYFGPNVTVSPEPTSQIGFSITSYTSMVFSSLIMLTIFIGKRSKKKKQKM